MPPPRGPLIGSGTKRMLVEAASAADMEHRDFIDMNDGSFMKLWYGAGHEPQVFKVLVRDGSVEVEKISSGYGGSATDVPPRAEDYTYLQNDVFDYWRGAIDDVFRHWEDLPESDPLGWDLDWLLNGAREIQLAATTDADSGGYEDGNSRLSGDIDNLFTRTADLSGNYAYAFNTQYVSRVRPNVNALHALTMVLAYGLGGEEELIRRSREQVADLCWKAKAAFEASGPKGGGGDATGLTVALIVVGAVAAGVAAVASGGTTIPATIAVASSLTAAGAGAASDLLGALSNPPADAEPLPLGADHPDGVLTRLRDALSEINDQIRLQERDLEELFNETKEAAQGVGSFDIDRPGILDSGGQDVLTPAQNVTVNPQVIADITHLWIPTICGELRTCAGKLNGDSGPWVRPYPIGLTATGPYAAFSGLQSQVASLLVNTAVELEGAAVALEQAAKEIGLSDEQANAASQALADRINTENINT